MRRAVYAGSFDPITHGHLWMIREAAELFDDLVVAIGVNPEKHSSFSLEDRLEMLRESLAGIERVTIASFENEFLVNFARDVGAGHIVRGIRDGADYTYERGMRHVNADMQDAITTVFLIPPRELTEVSSSFVKGLVGPSGWQDVVRRYVPEPVFRRMTDASPDA